MAFYESVARKGINSPYESIIQSASTRYGVLVALIKGIISAESGWNPSICSSSSCGLMQLNTMYFHEADGSPIFDPAKNIDTGVGLIGSQLQIRPSVELALAAYNAGTGRSNDDLAARIANNTLGVASYVSNVLAYRDWFIANDGSDPGELPNGGVDITDSDIRLMAALVVGGLLLFSLFRR